MVNIEIQFYNNIEKAQLFSLCHDIRGTSVVKNNARVKIDYDRKRIVISDPRKYDSVKGRYASIIRSITKRRKVKIRNVGLENVARVKEKASIGQEIDYRIKDLESQLAKAREDYDTSIKMAEECETANSVEKQRVTELKKESKGKTVRINELESRLDGIYDGLRTLSSDVSEYLTVGKKLKASISGIESLVVSTIKKGTSQKQLALAKNKEYQQILSNNYSTIIKSAKQVGVKFPRKYKRAPKGSKFHLMNAILLYMAKAGKPVRVMEIREGVGKSYMPNIDSNDLIDPMTTLEANNYITGETVNKRRRLYSINKKRLLKKK